MNHNEIWKRYGLSYTLPSDSKTLPLVFTKRNKDNKNK
jgi:hypothetical protein